MSKQPASLISTANRPVAPMLPARFRSLVRPNY
jgi:hypothetical protein